MTAVLPEPAVARPSSSGRHRAPDDATTGSMGIVPPDRRSRSAHSARSATRSPVEPIQRAARTGALSLAAIGALAGAGGVATHGLTSLGHDESATSGEMALPTHLVSTDLSIHPAERAVTAPAVMPVAVASAAHPVYKSSSPASRAASAQAAASQAKAAAAQQAQAAQAAAASSVGARAVSLAKSQIGVPYEWGGTTPSGFDCSGLMQWVYGKLGKDLPRTSSAQSDEGQEVASQSDLKPGDLVFFYSPVSHVAMYAGNGMIIEAPTQGEDVKMTPLSHYSGKITDMRRI